jgi:hypothetical protein
MLVCASRVFLFRITTMRTPHRHRNLHIALHIALLCMVELLAFRGADEGVPLNY